MWLLNTATKKLQYFNSGEEVPGGYAILSHTWGDEEVSFDEIQNEGSALKRGYNKIEYVCAQAQREGLTHAWVDTCMYLRRDTTKIPADCSMLWDRLHR